MISVKLGIDLTEKHTERYLGIDLMMQLKFLAEP